MTNSVWQAPIQNATGDIVIGAEITVIDEGTGLDATIFSTRGGAALTNPFFSDANGFAQFYAGPGEYRIEALDNGTGLTQTLRYVRLGDSGSVDTGTATGEVLLSESAGLDGGEINWTSGNLNKSVFGGLSGGDSIATAVGANASTLQAYIPLSSVVKPTSITNTGAFFVYDASNNFVSVINPPVMEPHSSSTLLILTMSGASGLTANESYTIRTDGAASKITVNF